MRRWITLLASCVLILALSGALPGSLADGSIRVEGAPGTNPPPEQLGWYQMTAFPADGRPEGEDVATVAGPCGDVTFDQALEHCRVGGCWNTWSHGYAGDVYDVPGQAVMITLPPGTRAFYLYVEPGTYNEYQVTATASGGAASGPVSVHGFTGARYFGFWSADAAATVASISVEVEPGSDGFAIGEFGISCQEGVVPPGLQPVGGMTYPGEGLSGGWGWAAALPALAALGWAWRRRRSG